MKLSLVLTASVLSLLLITGCSDNKVAPSKEAVLDTYANIALATYEDSLARAKELQAKVDQLLATPNTDNLATAKKAWRAAREPYMQTEAYRFGNAIVDDWEGRVNSWPLDEGLIDYVDGASYGDESDENPFYTANIIGNKKLNISGISIDASTITRQLIKTLHEVDEVEANIATGYHAIEFLLWGQDLNGTNAGSGNRPVTDFDLTNCTGGNCDRRRDYLKVATDLLVDDLVEMVANWQSDGKGRTDLFVNGVEGGLTNMLTGMGSMSYGELAGERIKLGLMLHDPEETHDCFSDNTSWSHYYDIKGIENVYVGSYTRIDGRKVEGPSLADLVESVDADLNNEMLDRLEDTNDAADAMTDAYADGQPFDMLIASNNKKGNALVRDTIDALVEQTRVIEKIVSKLGIEAIELEGSDSLDNPAAIQ